jgi:hypothetical protein
MRQIKLFEISADLAGLETPLSDLVSGYRLGYRAANPFSPRFGAIPGSRRARREVLS